MLVGMAQKSNFWSCSRFDSHSRKICDPKDNCLHFSIYYLNFFCSWDRSWPKHLCLNTPMNYVTLQYFYFFFQKNIFFHQKIFLIDIGHNTLPQAHFVIFWILYQFPSSLLNSNTIKLFVSYIVSKLCWNIIVVYSMSCNEDCFKDSWLTKVNSKIYISSYYFDESYNTIYFS